MVNGGGNNTSQSSPSDDPGGININVQLRQTGESNPNPWVRILGKANKTEIGIDRKISKALTDSIVMILVMSKGYYDEHRHGIQPSDQLVPIEGSGGADVPYFGLCRGLNAYSRNQLF